MAKPLRIDGDLTIEDIHTLEDCRKAETLLTDIIASMEAQINSTKADIDTGEFYDRNWYHRLQKAYGLRKAALTKVQSIRKELLAAIDGRDKGHRERMLLNMMRDGYPHIFSDVFKQAENKYPELFGDTDWKTV